MILFGEMPVNPYPLNREIISADYAPAYVGTYGNVIIL